MTEKYVDPAHRVPDAEWAVVVRRAKEVRQEVADAAAGGAAGAGGIVVDMTAAGIRSKKYFGVSGIPTQLLVLHSAECPLRAGYAIALSEWSSNTVHPAPPTASWQRFVDPVHRVRLIPDHLGAWHASAANPLSIGWEQAGYARFSREEWLTPDGLSMLELLAFDMAEVAVRDGIPPVWLTTAQVDAILYGGDRTTRGFCTHRQIDKATRTDPGNGYPYDLLMERIKAYMSGEEDMALTPEQAAQLAYIASPEFKAHIFTGTAPIEKEARAQFHRELLNTDVPWFGFDGTIPESGRSTTSPATDLGWADSRAAGLAAAVAGLTELVKQLTVAQGVVIDYQAIAKAVNDDAAKRLSS